MTNIKSFFTTEEGHYGVFDVFTIKSNEMHQRADISVYKPQGEHKDLPVVILLHGVYGSHWAWGLKGNVNKVLEREMAAGNIPPMLLVMPSDGMFQDGSGYLPHYHANYENWIAEEIPFFVERQYKEVSELSPFFLCGLSMGGYGALRIGAKFSKTFKAFSGLSSITKFEEFSQFVEDFEALKSSVKKEESVSEILLQNKSQLSPFRFDCGKQDTLYPSNLNLHKRLIHENVKHEFYSYPGEHSWEYWEANIGETLRFFANNISQ
jgi:S-formylglutathione hydrolase FrmB